MQIGTIGIDAKPVFQVLGVDAFDKPVLKKQLRRGQMLEFFDKLLPCLVGMEACSTSHHRARELRKPGHDVRLMPSSYVKAKNSLDPRAPSTHDPMTFPGLQLSTTATALGLAERLSAARSQAGQPPE
jgi:transposase